MKKTLTIILSLALVACISVAGTLAYLTSTTGTVKNTFTVGKVQITLDEKDISKTDGSRTDQGNDYGTLTPGSSYEKDPTVHVLKGSESSYVFIKVVNGLGEVEAPTVAGGYTNIAGQIIANEWTAYDATAGVYYKTVEAKDIGDGLDLVIFDGFTIAGTVKNGTEVGAITIKAAAVQQAELALDDAYEVIAEGLNDLD